MDRSRHSDNSNAFTGRSASEWFVRLDAGLASDTELAEFEIWLMSDPAHADAFSQCMRAVRLAASMPEHELTRRGTGQAGRSTSFWQALLWPLTRPQAAWSVTAVAVLVAAAGWWRTPELTESVNVPAAPGVPAAPAESEQYREPLQLAPSDYSIRPVILSPGQVVVDALSIGVRPFQPVRPGQAGDRQAAAELYAKLMQRLSAMPGVYALGIEHTVPFMNIDNYAVAMDVTDIASQLGVRSMIDAQVQADGDGLQLAIHLTDASDTATRLALQFEGSNAEVDAFLDSFVDQSIAALLRPQFVVASWRDN